jgi:hypothetical protein
VPPNVTDVYVTDGGLTTNLNSNVGTIINSSHSPVQFCQLGSAEGQSVQSAQSGIRRWPTEIVPPSESITTVLSKGATWQVLNPSNAWMVLGEITLPPNTSSLRWDGVELTVE